jgi:hypothetical protein
VVVDAAVTWLLEAFPFYPGAFPIALAGEWIHNPAVSDQNNGFAAGVSFGKAGKRRTWDLSYTYKYLEADAWYEEVTDSDTGAYYSGTLPGSGWDSGYGAGTNVKGHVVRAQYSPYDALTLTAKLFVTELIQALGPDTESDMNRFQMDATLRF